MRWKPSPFIALSFSAHLGALIGVGLAPQHWRVWLAVVVLNQAGLIVAGLLPRCTWLGPNHTRLPVAAAQAGQVALSFDDGPDPQITPQVLRLLEAHGVRATFFCIGERVRQHPELARAMVAAGHTIENHTHSHPKHFAAMGPGGMRRQIQAAQHDIASVVGRAPRFFRAVAGLRNPMLEPVLVAQGLQLAHWQRRAFDTRESNPQRVLARLTRGLQAGDIVLLHDGHSARTPDGQAVVLAVLPQLLLHIQRAGLRCVTLDEAFPQFAVAQPSPLETA